MAAGPSRCCQRSVPAYLRHSPALQTRRRNQELATGVGVESARVYEELVALTRIEWVLRVLTRRPVLCPHVKSVHKKAVADSLYFRYFAQRD